jgi:hypothetical protein
LINDAKGVRVDHCLAFGAGRLLGAFPVVELAVERDPGEHAVEPGRQHPGAVAEQCHHRWADHDAHEQHVDQDRVTGSS